MQKKISAFLFSALVFIGLVSCGTLGSAGPPLDFGFLKGREALYLGMSREELESILGKPTYEGYMVYYQDGISVKYDENSNAGEIDLDEDSGFILSGGAYVGMDRRELLSLYTDEQLKESYKDHFGAEEEPSSRQLETYKNMGDDFSFYYRKQNGVIEPCSAKEASDGSMRQYRSGMEKSPKEATYYWIYVEWEEEKITEIWVVDYAFFWAY